MKKIFLPLFSIFLMCILLCSCTTKPEAVTPPDYTVLGKGIEIPEDASTLTKAYFVAANHTVNKFIDKTVKKAPEFISFQFSPDVKLSTNEKQTLKNLFSIYNIEITDGLRSDLTDAGRGITVSYATFSEAYIADSDLSIAVKIYYQQYAYTYTCDFKEYKGEYVLFRFDDLGYERYLF